LPWQHVNNCCYRNTDIAPHFWTSVSAEEQPYGQGALRLSPAQFKRSEEPRGEMRRFFAEVSEPKLLTDKLRGALIYRRQAVPYIFQMKSGFLRIATKLFEGIFNVSLYSTMKIDA
jgi:hypothetical protein